MKTATLLMIHKLKQWDEEIKKQRFVQILTELRRVEEYLRELNLRFEHLTVEPSYSTEQLKTFFSEIQYTTDLVVKIKNLLIEISSEAEKNRAEYEQAYIEKKKVEQLLMKLLENLRIQREKLEERLLSELFTISMRVAE